MTARDRRVDRPRVAVVTGGGSGIGAAVATLLAREGHAVVVVDRDGDASTRVADLCAGTGPPALGRALDVTDPESVADLFAEVVDRFGAVDVAVNNAGVPGVVARVEDYPLAVWRRVLDVDLHGVLLCLREEIRLMRGQGYGAVVNMASAAGVAGVAGSSAYAAAKHAVVGLTKSVALEVAGAGIRVNAVCPGLVRTPLVHMDDREFVAAHPMQRAASPDEVADAVCWLLSDRASFVTGAAMPVDGGLMAAVPGLARPPKEPADVG